MYRIYDWTCIRNCWSGKRGKTHMKNAWTAGRNSSGKRVVFGYGVVFAAVMAVASVVAPVAAQDLDPIVTYDTTGSDNTNHPLNSIGTTFIVADGVTYTLDGELLNTTVVGASSSLTKTGDGTLYLANNNNAYTGATIVTGGKLRILDYNCINPNSMYNLVSGANSSLESYSALFIGNNGSGALTITNGGKATALSSAIFGGVSGGTGTGTISGENSLLEAADLVVGRLGNGTLSITDGGRASALDTVAIGDSAGSSGSVLVGKNSSLAANWFINVGVSGKGILAGTGLVQAGGVNVGANGVLSAGDVSGEIGTLTLQILQLDLQNNSTLRVDTSANNTADKIVVNGGRAAVNNVTIDLTSLNNITDVSIIQADDISTAGTPTFTLNGVDISSLVERVPVNTTALSLTTNEILLTTEFTAQSAQNTWTGSGGNTWDMTSTNWRHSTNKFLAGDWVTFDSGSGVVYVAGGGVTASQMDIMGGTWTFDGDILVHADTWVGTLLPATAPDGKLHISNNAFVNLNGNNTFTGGIDIESGDLILQSGTSSGTAAIVNNGMLTLGYTTDGVFRNSVSGSGRLFKERTNVTTLTGTNSYSGTTYVQAGTLQAGGENVFSPNSIHDLSAGTVLDLNYFDQSISGLKGATGSEVRLGDATLTINEGSGSWFDGTLSGSGKIVKSGGLGLILTKDSSSSFTGEFSLLEGYALLDGAKLGGTFSQAASTDLIVGSGAALSASDFKGTVDVRGTLTVASASFDGASVVFRNTPGSDQIVSTGTIGFDNALTTIDVGDVSGSGINTYTLMTAASAITGIDKAKADAILSDTQHGWLDTQNSGTELVYDVHDGMLNLVWAGTADTPFWNTTSDNDNWLTDTHNTRFATGDNVSFNAGTAHKNVVVDPTGVTVGTMAVNDHYSFTGGTITATGAVTVADGASLGLAVGASESLNAFSIEFNTTGKLNITGYTPAYPSPEQTVIVTSGGIHNFNPENVTVSGQTSVDFLTAAARQKNNEIVVETALTWNLATSKAHGTFTIDEGNYFTLGAALADQTPNAAWDGKTLTKAGSGILALSGNNSYSGGTLLNEGAIYVGHNSALGTGTLSMANNTGLIFYADNLVIANNVATTGSVDFDTFARTGELSGVISGDGVLAKYGSGTLALSGANTFSGTAAVMEGTLALRGNGSLASSTVSLFQGTAFDIGGANANVTVAALDAVVGSRLATGANRLDLTNGRTLGLDLHGAVANDRTASVLTVTGSGLLVDATTKFSLKNLDQSLVKNDFIVLASAAAGTVTTETLTSGRKRYKLEFDLDKLLMRLSGTSSFVEAINDYLDHPGNANTQAGGAYLDSLLAQPYGSTEAMDALDNYFTDITDKLDPTAGFYELQRFLGAYSANANQPLAEDANRFRSRWRQQNNAFINTSIFRDLLSAAGAPGFASDSGLASPAYDARARVPYGQSRIWAGGFGSWTKQNSRSGFSGYDYDSYGLTLGYEYSRDCLNFGLAAAYSRGKLEMDELSYENKPDILNLALYGAYTHDSGFFAEGGLGYGHAWNDYKVSMALGNGKSAEYGSDLFSADLSLGYIARLAQGYNLIPSVGIEYRYTRNDSWTENLSAGATVPANRFTSGHDNGVDLPLAVRANKAFRLANGNVIIPEVRAAYVYSANKSQPSIQSGFAGAPGSATMRGIDPGRSHWRFGAGLSGQVTSRVDFRLDYDYETRSGFNGHNLNASVGLSF